MIMFKNKNEGAVGIPKGAESIPYGAVIGQNNLRYHKFPKFSPVTVDLNAKLPKYLDLSSSPEVDQGPIGACVFCTGVAMVIDAVQHMTGNLNYDIDWKKVWKHAKSLGIADDKRGSFLDNFWWYFQTYGIKGNDGVLRKPKHVQKISKSEVDFFLANHYQIMTGYDIGRPMCDKNYFLRKVVDSDGGHCFRIMGVNYGPRMDETTWDDFGFKKESQFFHVPEMDKELYSMYVFEL